MSLKKVAITGSYAVGKSYVLELLAKMGYRIFAADEYVRKLYEMESVKKDIINALGIKAFDKTLLAALIYNDNLAKQKVEKIIHPLVERGIEEFAEENRQEGVVFFEIPLLFEANFDSKFDKIICIFCDEKVRMQRAQKKKGYSKENFEKIKLHQLSQEEKKGRSDYAIDSDQEVLELKKNLMEIIRDING